MGLEQTRAERPRATLNSKPYLLVKSNLSRQRLDV